MHEKESCRMNERPSRKHLRLREYDYSAPGAYFVTICVKPRRNMFWDNQNVGAAISRPQDVILTSVGRLVDDAIRQIPLHYPHISVDKYCIMLDHIHMIIHIHADGNGRQIAAPTLSAVVGHLKRYVSKQIGVSIWQKSFIERVIRNEKGYDEVWRYIDNNPIKPDFADDPICFDEL